MAHKRFCYFVPKELFQPNTGLIQLIISTLLYTGRHSIFIHFYTPILRSAEAAVYDAAVAVRPFVFHEFVQNVAYRERFYKKIACALYASCIQQKK